MISNAYGMAPSPGGNTPPPSGLQAILGSPLIMVVGVFAIFYFLIIRPQRKKEGEHRKFLNELQKGEEVITQSGIYGRVAGIADNVVTLEIANQIKIRVAKNMIAGKSTTPVSEKQS
jgi:preprotein translocase subunit YajC